MQEEIEHDENEDKLTAVAGAVKTAEFEPHPDGDKDDFGSVGEVIGEKPSG